MLGLSEEMASSLSVKATSLWASIATAPFAVVSIFQRILGAAGLSISQTVSREVFIELIQRLRPGPSPFPLIRIGDSSDGGYLVPDDLVGLKACFSPGVADTATFEVGLSELSIPSFLVDYSVDEPPVANGLFHFEKLFLAAHTDGAKFIRLEDWVNKNASGNSDLILQMDIEGSEWSVLLDTPIQLLERFRIMIIEFHDLDKMLTSSLGAEVFSAIMDKVSRSFKVVHLHANNAGGIHRYKGQIIPRVLELTFLRSDRFNMSSDRFPSLLPHPLDQQNDPSRRDIVLTDAWIETT